MLLFDTVMPEPVVRIAAGPPMLDIVLLYIKVFGASTIIP